MVKYFPYMHCNCCFSVCLVFLLVIGQWASCYWEEQCLFTKLSASRPMQHFSVLVTILAPWCVLVRAFRCTLFHSLLCTRCGVELKPRFAAKNELPSRPLVYKEHVRRKFICSEQFSVVAKQDCIPAYTRTFLISIGTINHTADKSV